MNEKIIGHKVYTTRDGDTFDALALAMYGDERLSHRIIQFNPDMADVLIFGSNVTLKIPICEDVNTPETLPPWRRGETT